MKHLLLLIPLFLYGCGLDANVQTYRNSVKTIRNQPPPTPQTSERFTSERFDTQYIDIIVLTDKETGAQYLIRFSGEAFIKLEPIPKSTVNSPIEGE